MGSRAGGRVVSGREGGRRVAPRAKSRKGGGPDAITECGTASETTVACFAQHCGRRAHLNDDLHVVRLSKELLAAPPIDRWQVVVPRVKVRLDVEALLLTELERVR